MAQADMMAPPVIRSGAPKAKMTIYFALLIISLVALLLGCLFMYLEIRRFGGFGMIKGTVTAVERPAQMLLVDAVGRTIVSVESA
jgi:uncharacterized membrane protein